MNYNFDEIIDRRGTNSLKYDFAEERGRPADVLPMWVADMDFRAPAEVLEELEAIVQHGIFGYSDSKRDYFDALEHWFASRFGWDIQPEWLVKTPGIVFAIATAIRAFTEAGDAVIIQQPVYYPFAECVRSNSRKLVVNELVYENGAYHIDFDAFEAQIKANAVRLFILCSPHNPVGRVWSRDELARLGTICRRHDVLVVSDEIHADFVYEGNRHSIFASLGPEFLQSSVICTAPSKTFNLAGLQASNIFIADPASKLKFEAEVARTGVGELNCMGLAACQAAYTRGGPWLDALKDYLAGNLAFVRGFLESRLPRLRLVEPQGTYLLWINCGGLGLSAPALEELMVHKAKLWLDAGTMFGTGGVGFERINIACPRATLERALLQLEQAVNSL